MTFSPLARSPSEYPWTWFFVVVLLLVPLFVVDIPPILDYPNHLARLYLLGPAAANPILSQFYQARWAVIPDLAIDAFMPTLLRFVPLYLGGKILLGLVLLLTVASAIAYGRAVFGVRRAWALASVLVAYNLTLFMASSIFSFQSIWRCCSPLAGSCGGSVGPASRSSWRQLAHASCSWPTSWGLRSF